MKKSRFTEEQITYALRMADSGTPVGDVCRQIGISEATFYVWKKKYAELGVTELRQLRQLTEENATCSLGPTVRPWPNAASTFPGMQAASWFRARGEASVTAARRSRRSLAASQLHEHP